MLSLHLLLTRILTALTRSKLPLLSGLEREAARSKDATQKKILNNCAGSLKAGSALSKALTASGANFDAFFLGMVAAGEESGSLSEVFAQLLDDLKKRQSLKRELTAAFSYPIVVLLAAVIVSIFLFTQVLPSFKELYQSLGGELPLLTRFTLGLFENLNQHYHIYAGLFIVIAFAAVYSWKLPSARLAVSKSLYKLPWLSEILIDFYWQRLLKILSISVGKGLTLSHALNLAAESFAEPLLKTEVTRMAAEIKTGRSFSEAASGGINSTHAGLFLRMGEESGDLSGQLTEASADFDERISYRLTVFKEVLQPALILIVGAITGFVLVSLFLPILTAPDLFN